MKKNLLLLAAFIVLAVGSFENVLAQDQTVVVSSTYNYSVTGSIAGSTFTWTVTGASGTDWSSVITTSNTKSINWLNPGTYTVSVQEVSSNSCPAGNTSTFTVLVQANTATIQFASITSADCDGASNTDLTLDLTLGGNVVYPVVVNYTVDGVANSRTLASGTSISLGLEDNILDNSTTVDVDKIIVITSATSHGAPMTVVTTGGVDTHTYTVWGTPTTGTITAN